MGFREQLLSRSRGALELIGNIATAPVRHYRAERIRHQQSEALLSRDDIAYGGPDFLQLASLAKSPSNPALSLELIRKMLWTGFAHEKNIRINQIRQSSV